MATTAVSEPGRERAQWRETLLWSAALVVGATAVALWGPGAAYAALALAGAATLLLVLLRPAWCTWLLLGLCVLLREYPVNWKPTGALTVYNLGVEAGATVYLLDVLMGAALAGVLLRAWWKREPLGLAPEGVPLVALVAVGPLFLVWGVSNGAQFGEAAADYRVFYRGVALYLLLMTTLRSRRSLLTAGAILVGGATLRILWGTGRYLLGHGESYAPNPGVVLPVPFFEQADAQIAALVAVMALAVWLWWPGRLRQRATLTGLALLAVGVFATTTSLRRAAWLTLAVGCVVVVGMAWRQRRTWLRALLALLVLAAAGGYGLVARPSASQDLSLAPVAQRATSAIEAPQGGSEALHYGEIADAWDNVRRHPVLGWGLGHELLRQRTRVLESRQAASGRLVRVHNLYLDVMVKMGLVGLGLLLWWIGVSLRRMLRLARHTRGTRLAWLVYGLTGTWIGWLVASLGVGLPFTGNRMALLFFAVPALLAGLHYAPDSAPPPEEAPPPA